MSSQGLNALRARVCDDPVLALRLRDAEPAQFLAAVVRVAAELGCEVMETDVRAAQADASRRWLMRWIL
jgi:hypothetical protein